MCLTYASIHFQLIFFLFFFLFFTFSKLVKSYIRTCTHTINVSPLIFVNWLIYWERDSVRGDACHWIFNLMPLDQFLSIMCTKRRKWWKLLIALIRTIIYSEKETAHTQFYRTHLYTTIPRLVYLVSTLEAFFSPWRIRQKIDWLWNRINFYDTFRLQAKFKGNSIFSIFERNTSQE